MCMGKVNVVMSEFYCTSCGQKGLPIWRRKGGEREAGHLKKIFCLKCQREVNHVECKPWTKYDYDNFKEEFEYGNFDELGQRKVPYGKLKEAINNGELTKEKTLDNERDTGFGKVDMDKES